MIVVDASVLAVALSDDGDDGRHKRSLLDVDELHAPEVIDLEVASYVRRAQRAREMTPQRAMLALGDLAVMPLDRAPHTLLLGRIWELRHNLTPYDAAYVALAEALGLPLFTADRGLARAPGLRCEVELVG